METLPVLAAIRAFLAQTNTLFVEKEHGPTLTSEESARARGEPMSIGAKALVIKTDDLYRLFVLPADRKFDASLVKRQLAIKKSRFADRDELAQLTGLVPGCVPPFGEPILRLPLFADPALGLNEKIAYNAGSLTNSIVMAFEDYRRICGATWFEFSQASG